MLNNEKKKKLKNLSYCFLTSTSLTLLAASPILTNSVLVLKLAHGGEREEESQSHRHRDTPYRENTHVHALVSRVGGGV